MGEPAAPSDADRQQAVQEMETVLNELTRLDCDLLSATLRIRHAYELLGLEEFAAGLTLELAGYDDKEARPYWREVAGRRVWRSDSPDAIAREATRSDLRLVEGVERVRLPHPLGSLVAERQVGYRYLTRKVVTLPWQSATGPPVTVFWQEEAVISPEAITMLLERYRNELHLSLGRRLTAIRAGHESESLWSALRNAADELAGKAGVGDALQSIVRAALSDDPTAWRTGLLGCRNVMNDLSRYLYRAPGSHYRYILPTDRDPAGISVDGDNYRNRLIAYLHQKGARSGERKLADEHLEWFKGFAATVNDLGSTGKRPVPQREARDGLLHLYQLIGEVASHSDGEPITALIDPSARPSSLPPG